MGRLIPGALNVCGGIAAENTPLLNEALLILKTWFDILVLGKFGMRIVKSKLKFIHEVALAPPAKNGMVTEDIRALSISKLKVSKVNSGRFKEVKFIAGIVKPDLLRVAP